MSYCGDRTYSVNLPALLTLSGTTITLKSNSLTDFGSYTGTVTCSLSLYTSAAAVSKTFAVTVTSCIVTALTTSSTISA